MTTFKGCISVQANENLVFFSLAFVTSLVSPISHFASGSVTASHENYRKIPKEMSCAVD
jgi:hypothetical protein